MQEFTTLLHTYCCRQGRYARERPVCLRRTFITSAILAIKDHEKLDRTFYKDLIALCRCIIQSCLPCRTPCTRGASSPFRILQDPTSSPVFLLPRPASNLKIESHQSTRSCRRVPLDKNAGRVFNAYFEGSASPTTALKC